MFGVDGERSHLVNMKGKQIPINNSNHLYICVCVCIYIYIYVCICMDIYGYICMNMHLYKEHTISFQTFFVWALLLIVHA